jgi:ethanolamine permease
MSDQLKRTLGPVMIWGLGVGYVVSGMYFGWNLGLPEGGPYGMLAATIVVTILYACFVLGYAELACAVPKAGGAFVYAARALGPGPSVLAGTAQLVEYVFAPPAIAFAIGAYVNTNVPAVPPLAVAIGAYVLFTGLNAWGVKHSAIFELVVTVLAVAELLIFAGVTLPSFSFAKFATDPLPNGWLGAFAALPFAIWFYLAIEGIANVAEEAKDPQRDLSRGFLSALATLVVLALLVLFGAVGVEGWRAVVFPPGSESPSDSPLPLAMGHVVGTGHPLFHLLVTVGLFGLVASFHGILLAAGRATLELGRSGMAPRILGTTNAARGTPVAALVGNMLVGIGALFTGKSGDIILVSVYGALTLYAISMVSLFALRKKEPELARPYRTPLYPAAPALALVLSVLCTAAMVVRYPWHGLAYAGILALAYSFWFVVGRRAPSST